MTDHRYLTPKAGPYQSQHGEDAWLERYFGGKRHGFFVDVGAYDGIVISNSYYFEQIGWSGVLVEPHPDKAAACRANRPASQVFACAAVASGDVTSIELIDVQEGEVYSTTVQSDFNLQRLREYGLEAKKLVVACRTLDSILSEVAPSSIDFLSIDVEGAELDVLEGFDLARWKPRLVLVESPTPRLEAIRRYFVERGYAYLRSIDINDIYAPVSSSLPFTDAKGVVSAIDRGRYSAWKAFSRVKRATRVRTRLRALGIFR